MKTNKQRGTCDDGAHYECAGLATRFALGWLARAEDNLRSTRRSSRSPHHHELERKARLLQRELLDLTVELFQAAHCDSAVAELRRDAAGERKPVAVAVRLLEAGGSLCRAITYVSAAVICAHVAMEVIRRTW